MCVCVHSLACVCDWTCVHLQDLAETYLPAFKRAVEADAGGVMCSCALSFVSTR